MVFYNCTQTTDSESHQPVARMSAEFLPCCFIRLTKQFKSKLIKSCLLFSISKLMNIVTLRYPSWSATLCLTAVIFFPLDYVFFIFYKDTNKVINLPLI